MDIGEIWTYTASGTAIAGNYSNTGTATGSYNGTTVNASDPSSYNGISGPGVRTPGFWQQWTIVWDGNTGNDSTFANRAFFPGGDILYSVTDPVSGSSSATAILIGDWNKNGITDNGENTIFYTVQEAQKIVSADQKVQQDVRYTLDRSLVASWLNYLAGNPGDTVDINNGVKWLQAVTPDENGDKKGDGYLAGLGTNSSLDTSTANPATPANSSAWNTGITTASILQNPFKNNTNVGYPIPSGSSINRELDRYNNTGSGIAATPA